MAQVSIPRPKGQPVESSRRIKAGPVFTRKKVRKMAAGMSYGKARHC